MLRIDAGNSGRYCDGLSRRSFVQLGMAGMGSLGMADILRAREAGGDRTKREVSTILLWLDGGPSHMDLYDMKPFAPAEYRGMWTPINTNVPGMQVTELFPLQAKLADKFSIVRSLHHDTGDHFAGGHRMLTSHAMGVSGANKDGRFPGIGSVVASQVGPMSKSVPSYIAIPYAMSIGIRPGYFGGNWLGVNWDPFQTGGNPSAANFKVDNLSLAKGMTVERLEDRRNLRQQLDQLSRNVDRVGQFTAMDKFDHQALEFVGSNAAQQAFDISQEDDATRDKYGRQNWGQSTLLARRLVEAGSRFVTVHFGGWDHHWNLREGMDRYLPQVDACVHGLLTDLDERGLLETTLVVLCGEFSRTPRMNDGSGRGTPGRDHWGNSMFCFFAGGGTQGGRLIGSTEDNGERPRERPVTPANIHATIYQAMGIDPALTLRDPLNRPIRVLDDPTPIDELF